MPESTRLAFNWALGEAKAEVLEIDVQVTRDERLVVWHGPELDNVKIAGKPNRPAERNREDNDIRCYRWDELRGRAWVADPSRNGTAGSDLSSVPEVPQRELFPLEDFLQSYPSAHLNIELKPDSVEVKPPRPIH